MVRLISLGLRAKSDVGIIRKLEDTHQSLTLPGEQGEAMKFLANIENAQRVNNLVEDIREALIDYQVCSLNTYFSHV